MPSSAPTASPASTCDFGPCLAAPGPRFAPYSSFSAGGIPARRDKMSQRRQPLDLHELQRSLLAQDLREEQAQADAAADRPPARGAQRGAPQRGAPQRSGPPRGVTTGRAGPPARQDNLRADRFDPRPSGDWDDYAEDPMEGGTPLDRAETGRHTERGLGIDIHELLKREAFAAPQPACDDHFEKNRPCPSGVYGISDQYIVLDTFLKLRESAVDRGEFRWNFMIQGVTGDEVLGVKDKIDTVIEIQIGSFAVPNLPEVPYILAPPPAVPTGTDQLVLVHNNANVLAPFSPTLVPNGLGTGQYPPAVLVPTAAVPLPTFLTPWINNPYSQVPFFDRFTIQIREAGLQSYSDRNGARHHYEFTLSSTAAGGTNPNMLLALPQAGSQWDTFIFTDPLKDVHGLTLVFRNPDIPIRFQPDCLYDVSVESDASASPPGPFLRVNAPGHGLSMGDRVFITGFKSGNSKLDAYMNRPEGQVAAGDPTLPPLFPGAPIVGNFFWTDPAVSIFDLTIQVPVLPQIVTVCIAKRRMRIPIRLRRVVARLTNYIAP